jgi:hypothetical protein
MSVFIRRFTFDPGVQVFLEIEAVNVLDLTPPSSITGVGTGTAMIVGEFEDGPFNTPLEVTSATELASTFGNFGYTYGGVTAQNPCARVRYADGAVVPEYWNGNGLLALNAKRFSRLLITRADTSVGVVDFERCASIVGGSAFTYSLSPAQTFIFGTATASYTVTFNAAAATLTSAAGVYPTGFTGGEVMTIVRDGITYTVVFQASDQTQTQVIDRINGTLGYTAAVNGGGGVTTLSSLNRGSGATIAITAPTTASVLAATGFVIASATGTGNVLNIAAVTASEIASLVSTASAGAVVLTQLDSGALRLEGIGAPLTGVLRVTGGTATAALGFSLTQNAAWQNAPVEVEIDAIDAGVAAALGFAVTTARPVIVSSAGVYPTAFVGGEEMTITVAGSAPKVVTFQSTDQTIAQVAARINLTLGYTAVVAQSATILAMAGTGQSSIAIPAGTRVRNAGGNVWVTMQTQAVDAGAPGPYALKVRPATDDGTAPLAAALSINALSSPLFGAAFIVFNPLQVNAALSESAIDASYTVAIDSTLNSASVAAETNIIWSARQSNAVRTKLRQNANDAASSGLYGRIAVIRPPLKTTKAQARSGAAQPGVGAYRDQRVVYVYPGVQTFIPAIATIGTAGGAGFTADGIIDIGADGFLASVCSQLPPEENPGQLTTFTGGALGIEAGNPDVQNLTLTDYKNFRASGICAPRMDLGTMIFQSGVTSVDPAVYPSLRNINRRRMADFIQDSLAIALKAFGKQLATRTRRALITGQIKSFMDGLLSPNNSAAQRIEGYTIDSVSGNTAETLALGIFRIILNVRTIASLDAIVLQTTVGESVDVSQTA